MPCPHQPGPKQGTQVERNTKATFWDRLRNKSPNKSWLLLSTGSVLIPLEALALSKPVRKAQEMNPSCRWDSERKGACPRQEVKLEFTWLTTALCSPLLARPVYQLASDPWGSGELLSFRPSFNKWGNRDSERGKSCPKALCKQVNQVPRSLSLEANVFCRGWSKQRLPCSFYVEAPWVFFFFPSPAPPCISASSHFPPEQRARPRHPSGSQASWDYLFFPLCSGCLMF